MSSSSQPNPDSRRCYLTSSRDGGVLYDPSNDRLLKLNPIGAEMWASLSVGKAEAEVVEDIAHRYGVEQERVRADIRSLLRDAAQQGLSPDVVLSPEPEVSTYPNERPPFAWYAQDGSATRPSPRRFDVLRALLGLALFDVVLSFFSLQSLCSRVKSWPLQERKPDGDPDVVARVCTAVDRACVWYPKKALCLQRSAVTACLLRHYGIRATMVVGVRPMPFLAHAWVEADGAVVNDFPRVKTFYRSLTSY